MGAIVAALGGLAVAVFGFLVMRNPMRLSLLTPRQSGYYQRAFLDASSRNSTRGCGALLCLFGTSLAADGLGSLLKAPYLKSAAAGIWVLMGLTFAVLFCFGFGQVVSRLVRGKDLGRSDWFMARQSRIESGPIDVIPQITPRMQIEARLFTAGLIILMCVAVAAAIVR